MYIVVESPGATLLEVGELPKNGAEVLITEPMFVATKSNTPFPFDIVFRFRFKDTVQVKLDGEPIGSVPRFLITKVSA